MSDTHIETSPVPTWSERPLRRRSHLSKNTTKGTLQFTNTLNEKKKKKISIVGGVEYVMMKIKWMRLAIMTIVTFGAERRKLSD